LMIGEGMARGTHRHREKHSKLQMEMVFVVVVVVGKADLNLRPPILAGGAQWGTVRQSEINCLDKLLTWTVHL